MELITTQDITQEALKKKFRNKIVRVQWKEAEVLEFLIEGIADEITRNLESHESIKACISACLEPDPEGYTSLVTLVR